MAPFRVMTAEAIDNSDVGKLRQQLENLTRLGGYVSEPKLDGFRCRLRISAGRVEYFLSRDKPDKLGGEDFGVRFPEVKAKLVSAVSGHSSVTLDGEVGALVEPHGLAMDFHSIQGRPHSASLRTEILAKRYPATLVVFDVLEVGGVDLRGESFAKRRAMLEKVVTPNERVRVIPQSPFLVDLYDQVTGLGGEGIILKRLDGKYEEGKRSLVWLKVKAGTFLDETTIVGLIKGEGARASTFGSAVVARRVNGEWQYVARVANGWSDAEREQVLRVCREHEVPGCALASTPPIERTMLLWTAPGHVMCDLEYEQAIKYQPRHPKVRSTKYA